VDTVIFDVDGTLVDSNYQHALAWYRAFRRFDVTPAVWRIHRALGMGGDNLVPAVAGDAFEAEHGEDVRAAWKEEFDPLLAEICPLDGAQALLHDLRAAGFTVVLASSGAAEHVDHFLDQLDGRSLAHAWTTAEDAEETKPAPDLFQVALKKVGATSAVVVGDSTWDVIAASKLGLETIALRTGGFSGEELLEAGASAVFESLVHLHQDIDSTSLAVPRRRASGNDLGR